MLYQLVDLSILHFLHSTRCAVVVLMLLRLLCSFLQPTLIIVSLHHFKSPRISVVPFSRSVNSTTLPDCAAIKCPLRVGECLYMQARVRAEEKQSAKCSEMSLCLYFCSDEITPLKTGGGANE